MGEELVKTQQKPKKNENGSFVIRLRSPLLTIASYGLEVMGMFLRGELLIVANFSLYDCE